MRVAFAVVAVLALSCVAVQGFGPSFEVCSDAYDGPIEWERECELCGGRPGCENCINTLFNEDPGLLNFARECKTCIPTNNPGPCYMCITGVPSDASNRINRIYECKICANAFDSSEVGLCNTCLAETETLSGVFECKLCGNAPSTSACFSCLAETNTFPDLFNCKFSEQQDVPGRKLRLA